MATSAISLYNHLAHSLGCTHDIGSTDCLVCRNQNKLLYTIQNPRVIDLGLIAVNHEYKNSGLTAVFVDSITKSYKQFKHLDHFETNLNLEDNLAIRNMWSRFDSVENKRRRSFVKQL